MFLRLFPAKIPMKFPRIKKIWILFLHPICKVYRASYIDLITLLNYHYSLVPPVALNVRWLAGNTHKSWLRDFCRRPFSLDKRPIAQQRRRIVNEDPRRSWCTMYEKVEAGQGERRTLDCVIRLSITGGANGVMTGSERCQALHRSDRERLPAFRRPFNFFMRNCVPPSRFSKTLLVSHITSAHRNCTRRNRYGYLFLQSAVCSLITPDRRNGQRWLRIAFDTELAYSRARITVISRYISFAFRLPSCRSEK